MDGIIDGIESERPAFDDEGVIAFDGLGGVAVAIERAIATTCGNIEYAVSDENVGVRLDAMAGGVDGERAALDGEGGYGGGVLFVESGDNGVIRCRESVGAAFEEDVIVTGNAVVDGGCDIECKIFEGEYGTVSAFDTVLAVGVDGQCACTVEYCG